RAGAAGPAVRLIPTPRAVVHVGPAVLLCVLFGDRPWRRSGAMLLGGVAALAVSFGLLAALSLVDVQLAPWRFGNNWAGHVARFGPGETLARLGPGAPLLLAATLLAVGLIPWQLRRGTQLRDSLVPEALLTVSALAAMYVNPVPSPYNLVTLVPPMLVLCL